jgi:hypothetical protein
VAKKAEKPVKPANPAPAETPKAVKVEPFWVTDASGKFEVLQAAEGPVAKVVNGAPSFKRYGPFRDKGRAEECIKYLEKRAARPSGKGA